MIELSFDTWEEFDNAIPNIVALATSLAEEPKEEKEDN
jgi:hypothetical protein